MIDHPEKLPKAQTVEPVRAQRSGYLTQVNARIIGEATVILGAGRIKKGDPVDYSVGIEVHCKVGDYVEEGAKIFTIHANSLELLEQARSHLLTACLFSEVPTSPLPLFYETVS